MIEGGALLEDLGTTTRPDPASTKLLRVAVECTHLGVPGGIRTYLRHLLPALESVSGPETRLTCYFRGRGEIPTDELPVDTLTCREGLPRRIADRLHRYLGIPRAERYSGDIDVFHGTHFVLPPTRARTVLTLHDLTYLRHPEYFANSAVNDYGYRYLLPHSLERADSIVCDSFATQRDLEALFPDAAPRSCVVHLGVDPAFHPVNEDEIEPVLRARGIQRPFALFPVGTIDRRKNIERTLVAFRQAFPRVGARPLLVLTGLGEMPDAVRTLVGELELEQDVQLHSVGYPEELRALMNGATWGMYPSLYEGFGLPALEMLACGLPILASDRTSIPEVVGNAALLVDPDSVDGLAQAMQELETSDATRRDLSHLAVIRGTSPAASWHRCARQMLAIYRDDDTAFASEPHL